ncbi:glycosyltransferase family 2 protein [Bacillus toyonensis]|uniref:glycosyltransferase family 2 protein n=1 Tax=Bacillus toyonensis TaxID=155322 RepID=UPI002E1B5E96|nr:glycosyltransferase family 2 protein [Bacillus toyonensis]
MNITVALMVKNEKNNLEETIPFFKKHFSEVVIIDTGSTDGTVKFLETEENIIFKEMKWKNDFAAVRNELINTATGDYILMLDADERIDEDFVNEMNALIKIDEKAFKVKIINVTDKDKINTSHTNVRLFKNDENFYYDGAIHEQLKHKEGYTPQTSSLAIHHYGYLSQVVMQKNKRKRNMRILEKELQKNPNNAFHLFNMSNELINLKKFNEALMHLKRSLKFGRGSSYEGEIYRNVIHCLIETKRFNEAESFADEAIVRFPEDTRFHFKKTQVLLKVGRIEDAELELRKGLGSFLSNLQTVDGTENIYTLWELLKIAKQKRDYDSITKTIKVLAELTLNQDVVVKEMINVLLHHYDQNGLYEYIKQNIGEEEIQKEMFFAYRIKKGIKEIPMNKVTTDENRFIKLWESNRYEQIQKEFKALKETEKNKLLAMLYVYNLDRKKDSFQNWLLQNKTIKAIEQFRTGTNLKQYGFDGDIYVAVIEELIKQRNINEFSKVIQMFHYFNKKYWKQVGYVLEKYYFDEMATSIFVEYLQTNSGDFGVWLRTAELLYTQEKWDESILFAEKASQIDKNNFRPIELIVLAYEKKGEKEIVKQLIADITKQVPQSDFIKNRQI